MTVAIGDEFLDAFSRIPRAQQRKVREFVERFREHPEAAGSNYEPIQRARDRNLYSVRIDQAYRAVVFRPEGGTVFVLLWVDRHDDAYNWAGNKQISVNPMTGALQVIRVVDMPGSSPAATHAAPAPVPAGMFGTTKDKHLLRFGVPEEQLPLVRDIQTEEDLDRIAPTLPQEAGEALYYLASGYTLEDTFRELEKSLEPPAPVDTTDVVEALKHEDSRRRFYVVDEAQNLSELLGAPLDRWRIFLHPKQRRNVLMHARGPVRVLGGAGTGKTVVALHRAKHLAGQVFTGKDDRILFTTFTRNLATDIQENLRTLCTQEELSRIEVLNLDSWAANFLRGRGQTQRVLFEQESNEFWANAMNLAPPALDLPEAFYRREWEQVIQAKNVTTCEDYVRVSRVGRGTSLSRKQKLAVWPVFEEYRGQLYSHGAKEFIDLLRDARQLIEAEPLAHPYRAVVVDEAQDMSAEALRLVRALAAPGDNDLFIVGDAHQRIYRHKVALGACGIDIRGRGRKLRLNYRTTEEIRRFAVRLLDGRSIDDLDGGQDDQKGYASLMHGTPPAVRCFQTQAEECAAIVEFLKDAIENGSEAHETCVVARTKSLLRPYEDALRAAGLSTHEIQRDTPEQPGRAGVRLATLHRVKGLEFHHVVVASAIEGVIPLAKAIADGDDAVARRDAETAERALLYVALTRAKQSALISGCGKLSPFVVGP